jgi:hypothetical protein
MPLFTLDEETVVDSHPLNPAWRVVQTIQPYCAYEPMGLFSSDKPGVNMGNLVNATRLHPGIEDSLAEFVRRSEHYHSETGLNPDTNGVDNLVLSRSAVPELTLLDTGPIGPSNPPEVQLVVARQLSSLAEALREVA